MRDKKEKQAHYRAMPNPNRFWVSSENCYTEEELKFRTWVINLRQNSGIHPDYLKNPNSWFTDDDQALININKDSWLFSNSYKPRHSLTRDDFHVQPIDSQRLQWTELENLMQKTGDYLLLRNQNLREEHLNQPMNFVLLDINAILKELSQNTNINQVKEQLEHITRYMRAIEKSVSPLVGSDRLFFATCRATIDDYIQPALTHKIESQLLRERLNNLSKIVHRLSADRNRILHFALNANPVNPHPYGFSVNRPDNLLAYPTQVAKECSTVGSELIAQSLPHITLTVQQLQECKDFKLLTMNEEILSHYAAAITDLNELERFQNMITEIMSLLGQAGEVYTISQFKHQMLTLFNEIRSFVDYSSVHIEEIIQANTIAYHHAIQQEQDLSLWKKWLTSEQKMLKTYIKNQDNLAQFPSSIGELKKGDKLLKEQVGQIIEHLTVPYNTASSFEGLASQAQELNTLMDSMHDWISTQYTLKGLEAPSKPQRLAMGPPSEPIPKPSDSLPTPESLPVPHYNSPLIPQGNTYTPCPESEPECQMSPMSNPPPQVNSTLLLGMLVGIPIAFLTLYLIYRMYHQNEPTKPQGDKDLFLKTKIKVDDLIAKMEGEKNSFLSDDDEAYQLTIREYNELVRQSNKECYDTQGLLEVLEDLKHLHENYQNDITPLKIS